MNAFGPAAPTQSAVNFFQQSPETAVDMNALQRERMLAQMLQQRGSTPLEGQMVGGRYVAPSSAAYFAQLATALAGGYANKQADTKERGIAESLMARRQKDATDFMGALNGSPAQPGRTIQPLTANDDEGNPMPAAQSAGTPAVPGDISRAIAIAMQSQNPQIAGMGPELMKRQMDAAELKSALQTAGIAPGGGGGPTPDAGGAIASGAASNPAGAAPAGGGLPAGLSPQALALTLSRNPQAQALGKMVQEASKPQTITEGGAIGRYGPNGQWVPDYIAPKTEAGIGVAPIAGQPGAFQANPVQGYGAAKANIAGEVAGAEAKARDPYAGLVKIGDRWLTPAQARDEAQRGSGGGVGNGGGPVNGQPVPNPMAPRPGDNDRGMIFKQELDAAAGRMAAAQKSGDQAAFARAQQDIGDLLKEIKSNRIQLPQSAQQPVAAAGGAPAGGAPAPGIQTAGGGAGIPVMSAEDEAYKTTRAKGYAEQAPKLQQSGQSGASTLRQLDELKQLYADPNVAKGALAESFSGLKNVGASFGVDMKGLSSEQAAQAITNKMALDMRSTADGGGMPGAMSDSDREFLKALTPNLTKTPEGRAKIMDAQSKVAQRQIDVARLANQYEQEHGKLDAGFDKVVQDYAAKNRLFTQPTKGGGSKTNVDALLNKYR